MFFIKETFAANDANISNMVNPAPQIPLTSTIGDLLTKGGFNIVDLAFVVIGLAFFANFVMAGWDYLMSTGDPKKISAATSRITNGFLGLLVAVTAFLVVRTVAKIIGLGNIF